MPERFLKARDMPAGLSRHAEREAPIHVLVDREGRDELANATDALKKLEGRIREIHRVTGQP